MKSFWCFICLCVITPAWAGETDLPLFQDRFAEEVGKLDSEHAEKVERLRVTYLGALLRLESAARQSGDLEKLIALRGEIARAENDENLLSANANEHEGIRRLQATLGDQLAAMNQERSERLLALVKNVQQFTERMSTEVLRGGDLEGALAWRDWGRELGIQYNPRGQIVAPDAVPANELRLSPAIRIVKAQYGAPGRWMDVTELAREALDNTTGLQIQRAGNEWAGRDPAHGTRKVLRIEFDMAGKSWVHEVREGSQVNLTVAYLHEKGRALLAGE